MTAVVLLVSALLAAVAAAGVLAPFLGRRTLAGEPDVDPLEDERDEALRRLRDLEEDRAAGRIDEPSYRALRAETEVRTVAVLRALESRDGMGELGAGLRELRPVAAVPARPSTGWRRVVPALLAVALVLAVVGPALSGALGDRSEGQAITGGGPAPTSLGSLEQRVRDHPDDPAGRLDLAEAYLARGDLGGALEQYRAVLQLDPDNPEAHARVGAVLYGAGRPEEALAAVDRALEVDPSYPEALYYRGLILLEGLDRKGPAEEALRRYLQVAPFGAHRDEVRRLLAGL